MKRGARVRILAVNPRWGVVAALGPNDHIWVRLDHDGIILVPISALVEESGGSS